MQEKNRSSDREFLARQLKGVRERKPDSPELAKHKADLDASLQRDYEKDMQRHERLEKVSSAKAGKKSKDRKNDDLD